MPLSAFGSRAFYFAQERKGRWLETSAFSQLILLSFQIQEISHNEQVSTTSSSCRPRGCQLWMRRPGRAHCGSADHGASCRNHRADDSANHSADDGADRCTYCGGHHGSYGRADDGPHRCPDDGTDGRADHRADCCCYHGRDDRPNYSADRSSYYSRHSRGDHGRNICSTRGRANTSSGPCGANGVPCLPRDRSGRRAQAANGEPRPQCLYRCEQCGAVPRLPQAQSIAIARHSITDPNLPLSTSVERGLLYPVCGLGGNGQGNVRKGGASSGRMGMYYADFFDRRWEENMLTFGLVIGLLISAIGLITYWLAPRVGPNPIFGVRVGYSYASRDVWDQTNRAGGLLIGAIGVIVAILSLLLQWLGISPAQITGIITAVMIIALLGGTASMFWYARRLAQGTALAREIKPVAFRWAYLTPSFVTFLVLVLLAAYFYPQLPAGQMATHFGLNDQPNGWMPRDVFFATFLGMAALFVLLNAVVVLVATREPLIAFERLGSTWWMDPERGLWYGGLAFGLVNLILILALGDVGWYNLYGYHLFPLSVFFWIIIPIAVILIGLFFVLGRRTARAG